MMMDDVFAWAIVSDAHWTTDRTTSCAVLSDDARVDDVHRPGALASRLEYAECMYAMKAICAVQCGGVTMVRCVLWVPG